MENGVSEVARGHAVVSVDNGQFGRIFEGMLVETEEEESAAQGPHVSGRVNGVVCPHVQHFGRAVHRGRVSGHFFLQVCSLTHGPVGGRLVRPGEKIDNKLHVWRSHFRTVLF